MRARFVRPGRGPRRLRALAPFLFFMSLLAPALSTAAPAVDLHDLNWFVHVDLINPGIGQDLAYWQGVIDAAVASGNGLLEGGQGPFDQPCCTRLGRSVAVGTFGTPGDGFDVIDSLSEQSGLSGFGVPGSNAFLVDSITYCGGSAPGTIGCAVRPGCNGNGNDDPTLWMAVTVDAFTQGTLASVIVHERGHNACLGHATTAECQIMQGSVYTPGLAGCLDASECANYQSARTVTASGLECGCHANGASGTLLSDGTICTEVVDGLCSGGLCGSFSGDAGVRLIAAADPTTSLGGPPEDALQISALKGEWTTLAQFSPAADDIRGMAFATDSNTLFGVVPTVGDDSIVTIDPVGGTILAVVGTITNGTNEIVSMAYDPGASSGSADDRLLVLEVGVGVGEVRSIDPAAQSSTTMLGTLAANNPEAFTGLAYDSIHGKLIAATSSPFGDLYEIDLSTCPPSPCSLIQISNDGVLRDDASLAWSPISGMLYQASTAFGGQRTFYNVIDPVTGVTVETLSLDVFTPAGLAAVPEPGFGAALGAGLLGLAGIARRRGRRSFPTTG